MQSDFESSDDESDEGRNPQLLGKKLQRNFEIEGSESEDEEQQEKEREEEELSDGDALDDDAIEQITQSIIGETTFAAAKVKKLSANQLEKEQKKIKRSGVVYLSSIPPYMKPQKIRHIMSRFGEVERLYLKPEDAKVHKSRVKQGGNKKKKFEEGWVEFVNKRQAKLAAETLNGDILGGKKRGFYHDDVINVKYLKGFKWFDLTNALNREIEVRDAKKQTEISQANKINKQYIKNIEQSKTINRIESQKKEKMENVPEKGQVHRNFKQNNVITMRADADESIKAKRQKTDKVSNLLDKIF